MALPRRECNDGRLRRCAGIAAQPASVEGEPEERRSAMLLAKGDGGGEGLGAVGRVYNYSSEIRETLRCGIAGRYRSAIGAAEKMVANAYSNRLSFEHALSRQALQQSRCARDESPHAEFVGDDARHDANTDDLTRQAANRETESETGNCSAGAERHDDAVRHRQLARRDLGCELETGIHVAEHAEWHAATGGNPMRTAQPRDEGARVRDRNTSHHRRVIGRRRDTLGDALCYLIHLLPPPIHEGPRAQ